MRSICALPLALVFAVLSGCGDGGTDTLDTTGATAADTGETAPGTTGENTSTGEPATQTGEPTTGDPATGGTTGPTTGATGDASTTSDTTTSDTATTADTTGDPSAGETTGGAAQELPPIESVEALEAWLAGGSYKTWAVESSVHPSTGPHGGNVRTYVNDLALASLAAQNAEHPQDSATVKELYGDSLDEIIGYAVSLKTAPESQGGGTWYWYERINATTYGGDLGVGLCTGCHGGGADYILTPYPLQ